MADVIAEYMSASVAIVTRAENVDAFRPWSAWRISATSMMRASSSPGSSPVSMRRKSSANGRSASASTIGLPVRNRSKTALIVAI